MITSSDPSLAVLKGAVKYGLNPNSIAIRQSRQTYGLCVSQKFIVGLHPVAKQIVKNDQLWCSDVFERLVSIGQPLSRYHTVVRRFCPAEPDQNEISVQLYATDLPNPQFVTDIGVEKCAIIQFHLSQRRNFTGEREIEAELKFGETEISISANELINDTAVPVRCEIDFLC